MKLKQIWLAAVASTGVVALGCEEAPNGARQARSSAPPNLALVEELRIDGYDADLVPISLMVVREDGTMLVAQQVDLEIRAFAQDGSEVSRFGGRGEGPGEFGLITRMGLIGDTLWVQDAKLRRFSLFRPDGTLLRTLLHPQAARPSEALADSVPSFQLVIPASLLSDGAFLARLTRPTGPLAAEWTDELSLSQEYGEYFRISGDGEIEKWLASVVVDGPSLSHTQRFPNGLITERLPFANRSHLIFDLRGRRVGEVSAILAGPRAGTLNVRMIDAMGRLVYQRDYPFAAEPLSEAVVDSVIAAERELIEARVARLVEAMGVRPRAFAAEWEQRAREHTPRLYPPMTARNVIGRDGSLWIRLEKLRGTAAYLAFDPAEGNAVGRIDVPENRRIMDADLGSVWAIEVDRYGIPSIVRYRVSAPRTAR